MNLFGNSVVALDTAIGRRLWHFQMIIAAGGGGFSPDLSRTVSDTLLAFALPKYKRGLVLLARHRAGRSAPGALVKQHPPGWARTTRGPQGLGSPVVRCILTPLFPDQRGVRDGQIRCRPIPNCREARRRRHGRGV